MLTLSTAARRIETALRACGFSPDRGEGILVALSGGADSVLLLHGLVLLREKHGFPLAALHAEHGIRGAESLRDADFSKSLCLSLDVPFTLVSLGVPAEAERTGESIETAARRLRYGALEARRAELGYSYIAVAHHRDDQAETVLYRLLRGSGARGLCGMAPRRDRILRPLLGFSGGEIRRLLSDAGIPFAVDSTNSDTIYTRNFLRERVFPLLREVTPEPSDSICRAAELLRRDLACLDGMAEEFFSDPARRCSRSALRALPAPLCARVLRLHAEAAGGEMPEQVHLDAACEKIAGQGVCELSFPSGLMLRIGRDTVSFEGESLHPTIPLNGGENRLESRGGSLFLLKDITDSLNVYKKSNKALVSSDKIVGSLSCRQYLPGDSYRFGGMRREVRKLFASRHLSDRERAALPIVTDGAGILWIPGFGVREGAEGTDLALLWLSDKGVE